MGVETLQGETTNKILEARDDNLTVPTFKRPIESPLGCNYGSFTIVNGMIRFDDFNSFIETIDFIGCASQSDYESWQDQIGILVSVIHLYGMIVFGSKQDVLGVNQIYEGCGVY